MTGIPQSLRPSADDIQAMITEREHLHRHPELSMQEHRTAEYIEDRFNALTLDSGVEREVLRVGGTGVVLVLRHGDGPVVGFRADTDGLPVKEDTGFDFASTDTDELDGTQVPVMHACGHDTHIACALAAAQIMARDGSEWSGTVVFVLQPGEETAAGAKAMVADGLWEKAPVPDVLFGQHVFPFHRGTVKVIPGEMMAAADSLRIHVNGRGSHGSQPQNSVDPIVLGAAMITRLQTIVSREISPLDNAVVTSGTFKGGLKENVIPDRAEFTLNIRTLTPEVRAKVLASVERIVNGEAAAAGAPAPEIERLYDFPLTRNDTDVAEEIRRAFVAELGEEAVSYEPLTRFMGSEDFSELADAAGIPYCFWMFGGYSEEQMAADDVPVNHSPFFAPQSDVTLETGLRAALAAVSGRLGTVG